MKTGDSRQAVHLPARLAALRACVSTIASERELRRREVRRRATAASYMRADVDRLDADVGPGGSARSSARTPVVCDRTAAWVHGVDATAYAELDVDPPLETTSCAVTARPTARAAVGARRDLVPVDWTIIGGVPRDDADAHRAGTSAASCPARRARRHGRADARARPSPSPTLTAACFPRVLSGAGCRTAAVSWCRLVDGRGRVDAVSHGLESRSTITGCPRPRRSTGCTSTASRRTDWTWPTARPGRGRVRRRGVPHRRPADRARDASTPRVAADHGWTVIVVDKHVVQRRSDRCLDPRASDAPLGLRAS